MFLLRSLGDSSVRPSIVVFADLIRPRINRICRSLYLNSNQYRWLGFGSPPFADGTSAVPSRRLARNSSNGTKKSSADSGTCALTLSRFWVTRSPVSITPDTVTSVPTTLFGRWSRFALFSRGEQDLFTIERYSRIWENGPNTQSTPPKSR